MRNTIDVARAAHELPSVHAVVLAMKIESRMNHPHEDMVRYYHDPLRANLFAEKLIVVHPEMGEDGPEVQGRET